MTLPLVNILAADTLTCGQLTSTLTGTLAIPLPQATYLWSTSNGNLTGTTNTLVSSANMPGTYQLSVTNAANQCSSTATVTVAQNTTLPTAAAGPDRVLTCTNTLSTLGGNGSSTGANIGYAWSSPNAAITTTDTLANLAIAQAGTYVLLVTDANNQCTARDTALVTADQLAPLAVVAPPPLLTCTDSLALLDGSASGGAPALSFQWSTADGSLVGNTSAAQVQAGQAGSYQLVVTNTANGCTDTTQINVAQDANFPTANIAPALSLDCLRDRIVLQGTASSTSGNTTFLWSTPDGNIQAGGNTLQPTIDAAGTYLLQVTDGLNNCRAQASVQVLLNNTPPVAEAGTAMPFGCTTTSLQLDGSGSTSANTTYQWSTSNGQIGSGMNTSQPTISSAGTYTLLVTDTSNNCTASDEIIVTADTTLPVVQIVENDTLDCLTTSLLLDATGSDNGADFTLNWMTPDGAFASGQNGLSPMVTQGGTYILEITNTNNDCTNSAMVTVVQDTLRPTVQILPPATLTCSRNSIDLRADGSSQGATFVYSWISGDGQISGAADSLVASATATGTYTFTVVNTDNQCEVAASVVVTRNDTPPVANAAPAPPLNCDRQQLSLDGSGSDQGINFTYRWQTADGQILGDTTALAPLVDAAGTYTLLVTNTDNDCTATATTTVAIDTLAPVIQLAPPGVLTCRDTFLTLDASASSGSGNLAYAWSHAGGAVIANPATPLPSVTASGDYTLTLTNTDNGCSQVAQLTVAVDRLLPVIVVAAPDTLDCLTLAVDLDATGSNGQALGFSWSTVDGNISANATSGSPTVTAAGSYTLVLTDDQNGCTAETTVTVLANDDPPLVAIAPPQRIDCTQPSITLDGSGSSSLGTNPTYRWSTADGQLVGGTSSSNATAATAGAYLLTIVNTDNGCQAENQVQVTASLTPPGIVLAPVDTLDCITPTVTLAANGSSGSNLGFAWLNGAGNLLSATAAVDVVTPGNYGLLLTDQDNGCTDTLAITVVQDTLAPVITIATPEILSCSNSTLLLHAEGSSTGMPFSLLWTTANGQIEQGASTLQPEISQPGTYQLLISNTRNGCSTSASVAVGQDAAVPSITFAPPAVLTCLLTTTTLDATASSSSAGLVYTWTTPNGQLISGTDNLSPVVGAPGVYTLTILNPTNGCSNSANLMVNQDIQVPVAAAGADFDLSCTTNSSTLNGQASSQGSNFAYQWTATGGQIIAAANTLLPAITQAGTYVLQVTNTSNGCVDSDQVVVAQDIPVAVIETVQPLCFGDRGAINFVSVQGGTPPYVYSINGGQSLQPQSFFPNLPAGPYASLVEDSNGCVYAATLDLVQPDSIQLYIGATDLELDLGDSIQLVVQTNYLPEDLPFIEWEGEGSFSCRDCLTPVVRPTESTRYRLRVATADGCAAEVLLRILVNKDFPVYIPTAFSPNGDGVNELFYIFSGQGTVAQVRNLSIFNRWGNEVFYAHDFPTNDPSYGWDGTLAGDPLNNAVFVYVAEIEFLDGHVAVFKGEVILVR
ncbi:MAG: hypothetical protein C7N36_02895 [Bacteroidetes bacterium]|nr:MAG: hypothetical protein C7N36_02895 [Bacteroidota bacterium]